ncbi:MAG: MurR/RpiR family transcriptional regulator [Bacillota bacterium]
MNKEAVTIQSSQCCLPLIRGRYPALRPSERKVAEYILARPSEVALMSTVELGRAAGVSESTVVKFSQNLGFQGFTELKLALVRELAATPSRTFGDVEPGDSIGQVKDKVFQVNAQALLDTAKVLESDQLQRAVQIIEEARRVDFFGIGASGIVALDAQLKFMRIGIDAGCYPDSHVQATRAALLGPGDVAVVITHSGETHDAIDVLKLASEAGAKTVCITNYPASSAARLADVVLLTSAEETDLRGGALASRVAQLTVVDCLFTSVAVRRHEEAMSCIMKTRRAVANRRG